MKKFVISLFALVACCLSLTSFADQVCTPGTANFCSCFVGNCVSHGIDPAACGNYNYMKQLISSQGGADNACNLEGNPNGHVACVTAINSFINNNPPESPTCKSLYGG